MSNPTSFQTILIKYRKFAFSERDKGDKFERLMQAYLQTDPKYAYRFKNVWLWTEFPGKLDLGGSDTGIDLVALTHDGDYWAVQCKCYQETSVIDKPAVDSFLSTSSREFKNEQLKTVSFAQRLWISTTNKWGPNATESIKNQNPPVVRLGLYDLIEAPVDWGKLDNGIHGKQSRIGDRDLKPHQKEALNKTHEHFKTQSRGKLIMACGTGKTFNSLRIAEKETDGKGLVLFLVPSIALLGQTLREWTTYAKEPINAVCICSDPEVSKNRTRNDDSDSFSVVDLALPASTNVKDIIHHKLIGCINALSKQVLGDLGIIKDSDPEPMRRAVAFCQSIAVSRKITATFNTATDAYISSLPDEKKEQMVSVDSKHIDGTMSAPQRDELLGWLKADTGENECRVLTNVRCLSEGVDVPTLDAVLFLSARNSQVDVVQSVGRVMRKAPGKKYGYIIIPVVVPSDVDAAMALDDNERYKVVWTVLNALRAHDDRFNATVNKIELNKQRPEQILVGRPEYSFDGDGMPWQVNEDQAAYGTSKDISRQLALQFEQLQNVVFARLVNKVGDRRYWEQWAKSVAEIAERQLERITRLIQDSGKHQLAFDQFLSGLQSNINPSITQQEAVEMLSQHIITKLITKVFRLIRALRLPGLLTG